MLTKQKTTSNNSNSIIDKASLRYCDKKNLTKESLSNIRIIKKNLVYVIGITKEMANKNVTTMY